MNEPKDDASLLSNVRCAYNLLPKMLKQIRKRQSGETISIKSPFNSLNQYIPGFYGGDLVVIAGRPSMGKTAFAGNLAWHFAHSAPILFFSLEMSAEQILTRLIASATGLGTQALTSSEASEGVLAEIALAREEHAEVLKNIYVVDNAGTTAQQFADVTAAFCEAMQGHVCAVFVDYLQLMSTSGGSEFRERDVAHCSAVAKRVARGCNVPVFLLSQLSRAVEIRGNKRPFLSDLRESGAIEQDADAVLFLFREDYYQLPDAIEGQTEIIISKHRSGPTGSAIVWFDSQNVRFTDGT